MRQAQVWEFSSASGDLCLKPLMIGEMLLGDEKEFRCVILLKYMGYFQQEMEKNLGDQYNFKQGQPCFIQARYCRSTSFRTVWNYEKIL